MAFNICPFCNERPATKTNSHIISDFLTKSMKESPKGNRVYSINKFIPEGQGNYQYTQDTSKQDYIFCPECESQFNLKFERHIANTFHIFYIKRTNCFDVYLKSDNVRYRVYANTNYEIFKKFLLLQLYRMHVSTLPEFSNINLNAKELKLVHKNLFDPDFFEDVKITVFSTDFVDDKMDGIFAKDLGPNSYFALMNNLVCVYEFDNTKKLFRQTDGASNYETNSPRIIYLGEKQNAVLINTIAQLIVNQ